MRVFGRALILGFLVAVCAPSGAAATPFLLADSGNRVDGGSCVVAGTTLGDNCGLFDLLVSSDPTFLSGGFDFASDASLFAFELEVDSFLTVETSSFNSTQNPDLPFNFDPTLALFRADGSIVILDGDIEARQFDIALDQGDYNDRIDAVPLTQGRYFLALIADPNQYRTPLSALNSSLTAGFECDAPELGCSFGGLGNRFDFSVSATPVDGGPAPVPEPGTLTLMAGGALAGLIQRRRSKKRNRAEPVSR